MIHAGLVAGSVLALSSAAAAAPACDAGETTLFSCQASATTIAVCAGGTGRNRWVQYRFRRGNRLELAYPAVRRGSGNMTYATTGYSGGGAAQAQFETAGVTYAIYSKTIRTNFGPGGNNPKSSAGVVVRDRRGRVSDRVCTWPREAQFAADPRDYLREGEFIESSR